MSDGRVRTIFIGSGGFGRASLRRLLDHAEVELVGIVTAAPRAAGRKQDLARTVIHELADTLGLAPILTPVRLRAPDSMERILDLAPGLAILADYGQIVPPALLGLPHGALNLHPSLLPRHRGAAPVAATILAGDPVTGVTLMRMDAGLDTGPIVAQRPVDLSGTETAPDLEDRLATLAGDLLHGSLGGWIRGELVARPQPDDGVTMTRPLRREDGRLDPRSGAVALERQVRALQPWPGSFVETIAGRLVVWLASVERGGSEAGILDEVGLATTDGRLVLHEVQPAGGRRMKWADYVRGHPVIVGSAVIEDDRDGAGPDLR